MGWGAKSTIFGFNFVGGEATRQDGYKEYDWTAPLLELIQVVHIETSRIARLDAKAFSESSQVATSVGGAPPESLH